MKKFIIPIFIPHWGCPHQCIFCSQRSITGCAEPMRAQQVEEAIQAGLERLNRPRWVEVAYYGGSFTALPLSLQAELLQSAHQALTKGQIQGIRLSTRPDCISDSVISLLKRFSVNTVELGVQSFDDAVLAYAERGHCAVDSVIALNRLRAEGFFTVAQLMIGLPGETWDSLLTTAGMLIRSRPHAIRIYPTVVLPNTPLATLYQSGRYHPCSLSEAVSKAAYLKWWAEVHGISVIRVGLQATEELNTSGAIIAGPYHPAFGEMVASRLFYLMAACLFESVNIRCSTITLQHHPKDHSKVRGIASENIRKWQESFGISVKCQPNVNLEPGQISIDYAGHSYIINSSILFNV